MGNVWYMQGSSSQQVGLAPPPDRQQALHTYVNIRWAGQRHTGPVHDSLSAKCKQGDPRYPCRLQGPDHSDLSPSRWVLFRSDTRTNTGLDSEYTHANLIGVGFLYTPPQPTGSLA